MNKAIKQAISIAGGQSKLASLVGTNQSTVSKWLRGSGIRSKYLQKIESATKGRVSIGDILTSISAEQ